MIIILLIISISINVFSLALFLVLNNTGNDKFCNCDSECEHRGSYDDIETRKRILKDYNDNK